MGYPARRPPKGWNRSCLWQPAVKPSQGAHKHTLRRQPRREAAPMGKMASCVLKLKVLPVISFASVGAPLQASLMREAPGPRE